jgi:hypothetical protein
LLYPFYFAQYVVLFEPIYLWKVVYFFDEPAKH